MAEEGIKVKLKALLEKETISAAIDNGFAFEKNLPATEELRRLAESVAEPLPSAQRGGEGTSLSACNIQHKKGKLFLGVYGAFECLYIREGYDALYDALRVQWRTETAYSVILLGNAGTGKSWYQMYALRRLLRGGTEYKDDDEYDFVFREVANEMHLIDIKEQDVYNATKCDKNVMQYLGRCLHFYEPGLDKEKAPTAIYLPGLATLSPYKKRIAEYKKGPTVTFYFWPWYFTELMALCGHTGVLGKRQDEDRKNKKRKTATAVPPPQHQQYEDMDLDTLKDGEPPKAAAQQQQKDAQMVGADFFDALVQRYEKFGGILRHIVANPQQLKDAKRDLEARLSRLNLSVLQAKAANIDRDDSGENVSGFILCYDGKQVAIDAMAAMDEDEQEDGFGTRVLRYTSMYVESKVEAILDTKSLQEKMEAVRNRLNGSIEDLSGKNLEAVATEFLRTKEVGWTVKKAGAGSSANWAPFEIDIKRDIAREYDIDGIKTQQGKVLVPTNTSFPVADMLFSDQNWGRNPVCTFQCTWVETHPFTVRALYQLREKKLQVLHDVRVLIYFIVPNKEEDYAKRQDVDFLKGSVHQPLEYKRNEIVAPQVLQQMWSNTEVHILRPKEGWLKIIGEWLKQARH